MAISRTRAYFTKAHALISHWLDSGTNNCDETKKHKNRAVVGDCASVPTDNFIISPQRGFKKRRASLFQDVLRGDGAGVCSVCRRDQEKLLKIITSQQSIIIIIIISPAQFYPRQKDAFFSCLVQGKRSLGRSFTKQKRCWCYLLGRDRTVKLLK